MKNAWNSNCSSSNCFDPNLLTRTKTTGLSRTYSLCEGRLRSHILQFPQTLVLFAVLFVDCKEWFKSLAESMPGVRRGISCILLSLEQSQVVDVMVAELLLDSILASNASGFEFSQLLLRHMNDCAMQCSQVALFAPLSIQYLTKTFCRCSVIMPSLKYG